MASALALAATRSLSNRKGRGRRSGGREREHRRAGEGRCLESKLLLPHRLSVIIKMLSWPVGSKDEGGLGKGLHHLRGHAAVELDLAGMHPINAFDQQVSGRLLENYAACAQTHGADDVVIIFGGG